MVLETSRQQHASVVRLMNSVSISAPRTRERETLTLAQQRQLFRERLMALQELMGAVS